MSPATSAPSGRDRRSIGGLVLAGGASRRLGRPKLLLELDGRTVLARSVDALRELGLDEIVVVLGCDAERIAEAAGLPPDPALRIVRNDDWPEGQASSLRRGVLESDGRDAVIVTLGDLPLLRREQAARVRDAWDGRAPAVAAWHEGRWQHPVLFSRALFGELQQLRGDVGGRPVLDAHAAEVTRVPGEPLLDVDTEADWRALVERVRAGPGGPE